MLLHLFFSLFVFFTLIDNGNAGVTSSFVRKEFPAVDIPLDNEVFAVPKGYNAPQQVHITQGDYEGKSVIVSWVTPDKPGSSEVRYGLSKGKYDFKAKGSFTNYTFYTYKSGYIHKCFLNGLQYDTKYYYEIGNGDSARNFWFETPPKVDPDASYTFGIIGDLGKEARMDSIRREIFQICCFFFIFHALFFTILFTSVSEDHLDGKVMCQKWWIPSILSVCTSFCIVFLVQVKLYRFWKVSRQLQREKGDGRALTRCISELRMKGASFDLSKEPQIGKKMKSSSVEIKWKPLTWLSQYAVTICLICFTGLLFPASRLVLCA